MSQWITLISSLPTENATARMRTWRALKASGAAVLRDGVYLMPERESCRATLEGLAADVLSTGGSALVMGVVPPKDTAFESLFDRREDYAALLSDIAKARNGLALDNSPDAIKQARKLRKTFAAISDTDFFPDDARRQAEAALQEFEASANRLLSPDEPQAMETAIAPRQPADYLGRVWATRKRPWVDRLASAWLIRRFIDPKAKIAWLESPGDCPPQAVGFDFDGATFSHVGARVTFEVLLASFGIHSPSLIRMGGLVHFLDIGGVQPPEASGIESVLAGLRETIIDDDDQLLALASGVFDGLWATFEKAAKPP
jgi:hypothetical protein